MHQISYTFSPILPCPYLSRKRGRGRIEEGGTMKFSDDCRRISFYQTKVLKPAYLTYPSSSISPVSLDGKNSPSVNRESERKKNRKIFLFFLAKVRKISRRSYLIADREEGGGSTFDASAGNASISLRINGRSPKGIALFTFSLINESKFRVFN